ncbi:MAG: MmgE/PrpD family protein [Armatimonadetes bacterium]|nr:MmgE/PrpD family protein [Armatimonadota bacterium]
MDVTTRLARFIVETAYGDLPPEVVHQAKRCFVDWTGVTLGGATSPLASVLVKVAAQTGGCEQATIFGTDRRTSALQAALVNGTLSHALDYDDVHMGAVIHPSAPVIPVIFALGEMYHLSGNAAIEALAIGYEVEARVGMAIGAAHYSRGWHATGTMGRLGAAAAAAKLLGLDQRATVWALGLAATQASGLRQVFGTMAKPFHAGKAAQDGLLAAMLAKEGLTCSETIIEGRQGLLDVLGEDDARPEVAVENLGRPFEIMHNTFKPHAACRLAHPAIDAAMEIRRAHGVRPEDIEAVRCRVPRYTVDAAGQTDPATGLAGKFSVYYCVAVALAEGAAGEDQFTDAQVRRPALVVLQKRVTAEVVPGFANTESEVTVRTRDRREFTAHVTTPKGDPANPSSDDELCAKFRSLAQATLTRGRAEDLLNGLMSLERIADVAALAALGSCAANAKPGSYLYKVAGPREP